MAEDICKEHRGEALLCRMGAHRIANAHEGTLGRSRIDNGAVARRALRHTAHFVDCLNGDADRHIVRQRCVSQLELD